MLLQVECTLCGKYLGAYQGENFDINIDNVDTSSVIEPNIKIACTDHRLHSSEPEKTVRASRLLTI